MKVEVFNGWIELRDPELVPERLRRPVFNMSVKGAGIMSGDNDQVNTEAINFFSDFNDLLAVAMIESWSFNIPLSVDGMLDLPGKTYDDIREAVTPFVSDLIPDFGVDVDPKAITETSNVSDG